MSQIEHKGVIKSIEKDRIVAEILVSSACEKCHLHGACHGSSETEKREVEITEKEAKNYVIGEEITLFFAKKNGAFAVALAYIIPLIICVLAIYFLLEYGVSEPLAALISLASIIMYFIILYYFRGKIGSKIEIKIKK
ncbi:MAG: SoxR reducing system RseC family protein [Rikenellaceae bacterium]